MSWEETLEDLGWRDRKLSWTDKMQLIVQGVADHDDWEEAALPCSEIADQGVIACREAAKARGKASIAPLWSAVVPGLLDRFSTAVNEMDNPAESEAAKSLLACAEAADFWQQPWEERIEAVARGDAERKVLVACALVADKAIVKWGAKFADRLLGPAVDGLPDPLPVMTGIGEQPSWVPFMGDVATWEHAPTCGYEGDEVMRCAEVADAYESRQPATV